ncbi:MAG: hypothetical protein ACI9LX_004446 [Paraglaciecola sp.]
MRIIGAVGSQGAQTVFIKSAVHIFKALSPDATQGEELLKVTVQWLIERVTINT